MTDDERARRLNQSCAALSAALDRWARAVKETSSHVLIFGMAWREWEREQSAERAEVEIADAVVARMRRPPRP